MDERSSAKTSGSGGWEIHALACNGVEMMTGPVGNDDAMASSTAKTPDYGQPAMLLIESLIHGLIARSLLSVQDAIEIIDGAADVREEIGLDRDEAPAELAKSLAILRSVSKSLAPDIEGRPVQTDETIR
jgi:hypothetical protein